MFNLKPTTYLWISAFCFIMCLVSGVCLLAVGHLHSTSFFYGFIGYALCGISFFAIGMCKGLE